MAKLVANNAINMETLNFASFAGGATSSITHNKNQIIIDFTNGDRHFFQGTFSINFLAQALGGTGTSWVFSNLNTQETFFSLTEAKIQATKAYKAGLSASPTDDRAVIADIFKGHDFIDGSQAADVLSGFKGNDTIVASAGDIVNGGDTKDKDVITFVEATGPVQIALVKGVSTEFFVSGVGGGFVVNVENVVGSGFADTITGDGDANIIDGGAGSDTITGGGGKDTLTGGADADTFRYVSVSDVAKGEILGDFVAGIDKIDLSAIDATRGSTPGSIDDFIIDGLGTSKSAVAEGHISWYTVDKPGDANDRTFIRINVDTNSKIDMTIELKGLHALSAGDFII